MIKFVIKADGSTERFDREKIIGTCLRAGANKQKAQQIANYVQKTAKDRSPTKAVYDMVLGLLKRADRVYAARFTLREAIANLDSESFELFAKRVLEQHGWSCQWNALIKGKAVEHQVDVLARREGGLWLIECKRHLNPHRWCGLGVALQVQARLEDILDGYRAGKNNFYFKGAWLWTNTKFSDHAVQYATAKGIRLTGWRSEGLGLETLVEEKKAYPVTMLDVDEKDRAKLLKARVVTLQDLLASKKKLLGNWPQLVRQARSLVR